jgi:DNA-binding NtrC family response regulator
MKLPLLLIDDNSDACNLASKFISWTGDYDCDIATDVFTALALAERKPYALAIIDFQMPEMNGIELFRRLRQVQPGIKAIFLTGFAQIDVVFPAIQAGVLRVLAKPVDFEELIGAIDEYAFAPI